MLDFYSLSKEKIIPFILDYFTSHNGINPNIYVLRIVAASFLIPNPFFNIKKIERIA